MSVFIYLYLVIYLWINLLFMYVSIFFLNYEYFYEDHIGNKCTFVCFNVFILGNIIYMLILLFAFASKRCLIVIYIYNVYHINSLTHSLTAFTISFYLILFSNHSI